MTTPQQTHNYHPFTQVTKTWAAFREAMIDAATRSEDYRAAKDEEGSDERERRDAAWRPPA